MIKIYFGFLAFGLIMILFAFLKIIRMHLMRRLDELGNFCEDIDAKLDCFINKIFSKFMSGLKNYFYLILLKMRYSRVPIKNLNSPGNNESSGFNLAIPVTKSIEDGIAFKEKINKLDQLIVEKSCELEKKSNALLIEIENRKEFENILNLLNQQINQEKSKYQQLKIEVISLKDKDENLQERIIQLIDEVSKKNQKIKDYQENTISLLQQMQLLNTKLIEFENFEKKLILITPDSTLKCNTS